LSQSIFGKTRRSPGTEVLRSILAPLVGIHRQFIARCYHRGCPAVAPQCLHNKTALDRQVHLADRQAPSSGRRKIEAALEASLGSPDHKCTSFHLAPGGQLCLGYRRGGRRPSREPGTWRGKKSLTFEVNTALRFHSTHQATVPAIGRRMFFKSLTYLGPGPQAGRSQPRGSQGSASVLTSSRHIRSQTPTLSSSPHPSAVRGERSPG
jgi:hypothetical protein